MATTPMMQQYQDAKEACGNALLLFRMGDFYELFFEDAKTAARVLGLTLTSRDKGENPIPMAGFPYHQLDGYLAKIIAAGYRAAVCEQVEDPKLAKGLVKREVTRVVSPGTLTDDALLDPRESNFLAAVVQGVGRGKENTPEVGVAWADVSTGRFMAATFPASQLADELMRIAAQRVPAGGRRTGFARLCRTLLHGHSASRLGVFARVGARESHQVLRDSQSGRIWVSRPGRIGRTGRRRHPRLPARNTTHVAGPFRPADLLSRGAVPGD